MWVGACVEQLRNSEAWKLSTIKQPALKFFAVDRTACRKEKEFRSGFLSEKFKLKRWLIILSSFFRAFKEKDKN